MIGSVITRLLRGFVVALLLSVVIAPAASASAITERAAIERLYLAAFDRPADDAGLDYWHDTFRRGTGLNDIADQFVESAEFQATYGDVNSEGLITLVYRNILGRPPDNAGLEYWVGLLDEGRSAGTILNGFAQSSEFIHNRLPKDPDSILMVGDSIFHGIRLHEIPIGSSQLTFMTEEGRHVHALPGLLDEASRNGSLNRVDAVVIHLGTNGWLPDDSEVFNDQVAALAPRRVVIVNTAVARHWEADANGALERIAAANPNAFLVDWNRAVAAHPEWMRPDGIHPNPEGLRGLAALIEIRTSEIF